MYMAVKKCLSMILQCQWCPAQAQSRRRFAFRHVLQITKMCFSSELTPAHGLLDAIEVNLSIWWHNYHVRDSESGIKQRSSMFFYFGNDLLGWKAKCVLISTVDVIDCCKGPIWWEHREIWFHCSYTNHSNEWSLTIKPLLYHCHRTA